MKYIDILYLWGGGEFQLVAKIYTPVFRNLLHWETIQFKVRPKTSAWNDISLMMEPGMYTTNKT